MIALGALVTCPWFRDMQIVREAWEELPVEPGSCPPIQISQVDKSPEGRTTDIFVVFLQKCPGMVKASFSFRMLLRNETLPI